MEGKEDLGVNSKSTAALNSVDSVDRKTLIIVNNVNVCQQKFNNRVDAWKAETTKGYGYMSTMSTQFIQY